MNLSADDESCQNVCERENSEKIWEFSREKVDGIMELGELSVVSEVLQEVAL